MDGAFDLCVETVKDIHFWSHTTNLPRRGGVDTSRVRPSTMRTPEARERLVESHCWWEGRLTMM